MIDRLDNAITKFFHDMAIVELRLQNKNNRLNNKLTYNSILYLDIIYAHQGEYTASNIADMLHVARPSVTQKLNELEEMGYIKKKQSEQDKRIYFLYATNKTNPEYVTNHFKQINKKVENYLTQEYSKDEIKTFLEMLSSVGDICIQD